VTDALNTITQSCRDKYGVVAHTNNTIASDRVFTHADNTMAEAARVARHPHYAVRTSIQCLRTG
jgi:hypothetical protein